jgi:hypothetical protein
MRWVRWRVPSATAWRQRGHGTLVVAARWSGLAGGRHEFWLGRTEEGVDGTGSAQRDVRRRGAHPARLGGVPGEVVIYVVPSGRLDFESGQGPRARFEPTSLRFVVVGSHGGCRWRFWPMELAFLIVGVLGCGGHPAPRLASDALKVLPFFPRCRSVQSWEAGAAAVDGGSQVDWRACHKLRC